MKRTLFYDFLPSKAVEDAERAANIPHQVTGQLIEIRDEHPLPRSEYHDCPTLIKVIDEEDVSRGKLLFSHHTTFEYMFRHWPMHVVQDILMSGKYEFETAEYMDSDYGNDDDSANLNLWFGGERHHSANWSGMVRYFLDCRKLFRRRRIAVGDEIHYSWDAQNESIVLEVVRR
ncbi:hypothetical protein BT93_B0983 [Corymbia citriodora subsp. variegata]|nr:hypothetical protein BT93_B0983 [Corymbia citriodora subsp. variegata]